MKEIKITCLECKKVFKKKLPPSKIGRTKFCSKLCRDKGNAKLSAKKRGDVQRGRGEGKTYTKLYGRHKHRVVVETLLGRKLTSKEIVHHIDGNKFNNDIFNLQIVTRSEHAKIHNIKNRKCEVKNCENKHHSKGMCNKHYRRIL